MTENVVHSSKSSSERSQLPVYNGQASSHTPPPETAGQTQTNSQLTIQSDEELVPSGWEIRHDNLKRKYYVNFIQRTTTWERPKLLRPGDELVPSGWEIKYDHRGDKYYIDHNAHLTTYERPHPLPKGWAMERDSNGRVYFLDHNTRTTTFERPRISNLSQINTNETKSKTINEHELQMENANKYDVSSNLKEKDDELNEKIESLIKEHKEKEKINTSGDDNSTITVENNSQTSNTSAAVIGGDVAHNIDTNINISGNTIIGANFGGLSDLKDNDGLKKSFTDENIRSDDISDHYDKTVGKISYNSESIIGRGSLNTIVYDGSFEGKQKVAVKVIDNDYEFIEQEIEYIRSLNHPNLVRYFGIESDNEFRYIAIEKAKLTLEDYVKHKIEYPNINEIQILKDSCEGLKHLHSLNIIHRNIKPQNILISLEFNGIRKGMISDYCIYRKFNDPQLLKASNGFIAPEVISLISEHNYKPLKTHDIYSLGCIFYYAFTNGQEPHDHLLDNRTNIILKIDNIKGSLSKVNLIESMMNINPLKRPVIEAIIKHPMFWNTDKSFQFIECASDRIENEPNQSPIMKDLENNGSHILKDDWKYNVNLELQSYLNKCTNDSAKGLFRSFINKALKPDKYNGNSIIDLLHAIKYTNLHYTELPNNVRESIGQNCNAIFKYILKQFPNLLIHTYIALQFCKNEQNFEPFYHNDSILFNPLPLLNDTKDLSSVEQIFSNQFICNANILLKKEEIQNDKSLCNTKFDTTFVFINGSIDAHKFIIASQSRILVEQWSYQKLNTIGINDEFENAKTMEILNINHTFCGVTINIGEQIFRLCYGNEINFTQIHNNLDQFINVLNLFGFKMLLPKAFAFINRLIVTEENFQLLQTFAKKYPKELKMLFNNCSNMENHHNHINSGLNNDDDIQWNSIKNFTVKGKSVKNLKLTDNLRMVRFGDVKENDCTQIDIGDELIIDFDKSEHINLIRFKFNEMEKLRRYSYYLQTYSVNKWKTEVDYSKYHCRSWQYIYFKEKSVKKVKIVFTECHDSVENTVPLETVEFMHVPLNIEFVKTETVFLCPKYNISRLSCGAILWSGVNNAILENDFADESITDYYTFSNYNGDIIIQLSQPFMINHIQLSVWKHSKYDLKVCTSLNLIEWNEVYSYTHNDGNENVCNHNVSFNRHPVSYIKIKRENVNEVQSNIPTFRCINISCVYSTENGEKEMGTQNSNDICNSFSDQSLNKSIRLYSSQPNISIDYESPLRKERLIKAVSDEMIMKFNNNYNKTLNNNALTSVMRENGNDVLINENDSVNNEIEILKNSNDDDILLNNNNKPVVPPRRVYRDEKLSDCTPRNTESSIGQSIPKIHLGPQFLKVFNGCTLKINCSVSWIHPETREYYIIFGCDEGIYELNINKLNDGTVDQLYHCRTKWLYMCMNKNVLISLSGTNESQLYCHNMLQLHSKKSPLTPNSIIGKLTNITKVIVPRKFVTTASIADTKGCIKCCVKRNPYNRCEYLCGAKSNGIFLMQMSETTNKFVMIKQFESFLPSKLNIFEMLITENHKYPILCIGVKRRKDNEHLYPNLINLNSDAKWFDNDDSGVANDVLQHMNIIVSQFQRDSILVCYDNCAKIINFQENSESKQRSSVEIFFDFNIESIICHTDSIVAFHAKGMQMRSFKSDYIKNITDHSQNFRMLGSDRIVSLESRSIDDVSSDLYILVGLENS